MNKTNQLNPKQEQFCQEYVIDHNGAKAAIRAGYSAKTANVKASQLLAIVKIKHNIAVIKAKLAVKMGITQESIAREAEEHRQIALSKDDVNAANTALALKARTYGLLTDKTITEQSEQAKELSENERKMAERYRQWRILHGDQDVQGQGKAEAG